MKTDAQRMKDVSAQLEWVPAFHANYVGVAVQDAITVRLASHSDMNEAGPDAIALPTTITTATKPSRAETSQAKPTGRRVDKSMPAPRAACRVTAVSCTAVMDIVPAPGQGAGAKAASGASARCVLVKPQAGRASAHQDCGAVDRAGAQRSQCRIGQFQHKRLHMRRHTAAVVRP